MKDTFTFWKRPYSVVNTSETPAPCTTGENSDLEAAKGRRNSFLTGRKLSLDQGIPPIIDSFFYQRKSGATTRQPKRKYIFIFERK